MGPDGKRYAVVGEVSVAAAPESDPRATVEKMRTVIEAALAPADPSGQDRAVAAEARSILAEAQRELRRTGMEDRVGRIDLWA